MRVGCLAIAWSREAKSLLHTARRPHCWRQQQPQSPVLLHRLSHHIFSRRRSHLTSAHAFSFRSRSAHRCAPVPACQICDDVAALASMLFAGDAGACCFTTAIDFGRDRGTRFPGPVVSAGAAAAPPPTPPPPAPAPPPPLPGGTSRVSSTSTLPFVSPRCKSPAGRNRSAVAPPAPAPAPAAPPVSGCISSSPPPEVGVGATLCRLIPGPVFAGRNGRRAAGRSGSPRRALHGPT
jgi:hypothetical protein